MASSQHNLDERHVAQRKSPDLQPYERNTVASSPVIPHSNQHGQPHYDEWQASHFPNPYAQHVQPYQHYSQHHHPFGANYGSTAWQPQQGEIEGHMNQAMAPQTFSSYATSNDFASNGYNSSNPYGAFRLSNDYSPGLAPSLHYSNPNLYGQTISPQELHRQPPQTFNESSSAQNDMAMPPSTYTLQASPNLASDVRSSQGVPVIQSNASPQLLLQTSRTTQSPQNPTPIRLISPTAQQLPSSTWNGKLSIRDTNAVCTQTESVPFEGTYSVVVTKDAADFPPIINTALPKYKARPSTKELRQNAPNLSTVPRHSKKRNLTELKSPRPLKQNVPHIQDINSVQKSPEKTQISTPSAVSSEDSETESSSDESSDEEEEQEEKIPLPSERPTSDVGGYEYDTIKALWLPTNKSSTLETIRASMQKFWDVLKPIGDKWTRVATDLKKAEAEQRKDDISRLKRSQEGVRRLFEVVVTAGIKYGNAQVLSPLGKHPPVLLIIQKFVLDRAMNNDTNGSLIKSIINFLKLFKDLDEETLETLKLTKPLTRLAKKGDTEIQALIRSIFESAAIVSKKSDNLIKTPVDPSLRPNNVPIQNTPTGIKKSPSGDASVNGIKRAREMELSDSHPNKRPISSAAPSEKGGNRTPSVQDNRATSSVKTTSNFIPPRPLAFASKPLKSTTKTAQLSSVQPSSQKLYSQTTVLPAKKAPVSTATSAPAKPAFSFMEAMAALTNPKPVVPAADTKAEGPAETEEEKAKRLRRESRRSLRVSFKPDDSLVEIRLFTHDQAEEIGREHNLLKDAKDAAEEGKMFKRHIDQGSLEEDEEGDNIESPMAWRPLTPLSFSSVDGKEDKGFIKRGGKNEVNSPESKTQQQREASTLMVVYTRQSDIPPTPREPSGLQPVHLLPSSDRFGEPRSLTREREAAYFAKYKSSEAPSNSSSSLGLASLLRNLAKAHPAQAQQPQPAPNILPPQQLLQPVQQPATTADFSGLEAVFAKFAKPVAQPVQPPLPPIGIPPSSNATNPILQGILASLKPNIQAPNPQQQSISGQGLTPDLSSVLAQLTGQSFQAQPGMPSYDYQYQAPYSGGDDIGRRERPHDYTSSDGSRDRGNVNWGSRGKSDGRGSHRKQGKEDKHFSHPKSKSVCTFYQQGKCRHGDGCNFTHPKN